MPTFLSQLDTWASVGLQVFRFSVFVSCSCKNCVALVPLCYLPSSFGLTDNSPFAEARNKKKK